MDWTENAEYLNGELQRIHEEKVARAIASILKTMKELKNERR